MSPVGMSKHLFRLVAPILVVLTIGRLFAQPHSTGQREAQLDSILQAHILHEGKQPVHNFLLYLEDGRTGNTYHLAAGYRGRDTTPTRPDDRYRIASITKTFVATMILQLWEEGQLDLQDAAAPYLDPIEYLHFQNFHLLDKIPFADSITIEQLLQHRSGLADIFTDAEFRFNLSVLLHKRRQYDVERIVRRYFKYNLNKKPPFPPGAGYHYSDMNYLLLGLIVEQVTGESLPQQIRSRILEPLGMAHTYYEYYEPGFPPATSDEARTVDAYLNRIKITEKINTSYEWGGGGMVSTTRELGIFFRALLQGELFREQATAERMMDTAPTEAYGGHYGMGVMRYDLEGYTFYGHGGFYGSLTMHDPERRLTFSANIGQANAPFDVESLVSELLRVGVE